MHSTATVPYLAISQRDYSFYLTKLRAGDLVAISYAAVRGQDYESGAVQRFLNTRRINSIKEFTLSQAAYPASIILNWVNETEQISVNDGQLTIPLLERSAQLIDGQHRVAGIRDAIEDDASIAGLELPVAIYTGLSTKECANIFLSINTEQKPVPRSLVFDLYQVTDDEIVDPAAARARDLVESLSEDEDSPYRGEIKTPGTPRRKGGVQLSTAVTAIKPLVERKGDLEQVGADSFELQKSIIKNFFHTLQVKYGESWANTSNAFMYASGFTGAIMFLRQRLIPYCNSKRDFRQRTMADAIALDRTSLIYQTEVKGKQGKEATRAIYELLNAAFEPQEEESDLQI